MGLLTDTKYWGDIVNQLAPLQPPLGEAISHENAVLIRDVACRALTALIEDSDFDTDLGAAILEAEHAANVVDNTTSPNFQSFLDAFMVLEIKLLRDSGANSVAANDLERELRTVASQPDSRRLEALADKIRFCAKLACNPDEPDDKPDRPLWVVALRGVKGVAIIGVNAGSAAAAAVALGPAGATAVGVVAGISAGYGAQMVHDAIKGRW